ncbi:hypothetical protein ADIARSV_2779 [Arcticibacter svalbardensis MN12-7]|uniref:Uncharacterized protein n=1 Tax=Arcticibacter svalbardensis MN12-7 TaxID=1150600 RepID=R9GQS4_9SPHI|nr:hypothetical protein [Arcticibacter svalbardensis]EOR94063.1 hypothetical protein ADIARSV_2779 [Arcticibacter svalbardensis MN12-7]
MNLKRTFGTILTILGIVGLIYAAIGFVQHSGTPRELIVYGVLGLIFFFTGIGLVRNTGDVAKMFIKRIDMNSLCFQINPHFRTTYNCSFRDSISLPPL